MKIENWNGHPIRFIERESNEWWAIAKDVGVALGYRDAHNLTRNLDADEKDTHIVSTSRGKQGMTVISEFGIYEAVLKSEKKSKEVTDFKKWVKEVIRELRRSAGLEGFQIFRTMDKDFQKESMNKLRHSLHEPTKISYVKANTIANKAVSTKYGYKKMVKKGDMTPPMLVDRQAILADTVDLMAAADKFNLDLSVSKTIYAKYAN
ncbi:antirepressor [Ammoniphilus oxalaticus]|uniref:Antirepressor n=2 Tax=Ammoniphilus oxalaticus TaxID=66863 RepID=A0A419SDX3_9BACL|nr:antirepressor [Ammoniphilus oxalaticus]